MKGIKNNSGKTFSLDFYKWLIILRVKDYGKNECSFGYTHTMLILLRLWFALDTINFIASS